MIESELKSGIDGVDRNQGEWDVDTLTEQIFTELNGAFTHSMIREVLKELAPKYKSARIQIYAPILIRREAVNQLEMQPSISASSMAKNATDGGM